MRNRSEILKIFGALSVVIILGIGIGWLGSRNTTVSSQASTDKQSRSFPAQPTDADAISFSAQSSIELALAEPKPVSAGELPQPLGEAVQNGEDQIADILGADAEVAEKSRGLLKLFPKLSEADQVEAARHLANLVSDEEYAPLGKILTNSLTTAEASEILLNDLLNRPNSIKVPLILAVARDSQHSQSANAQTLMERMLGEDYALNWSRWETLAKVWLEENPD